MKLPLELSLSTVIALWERASQEEIGIAIEVEPGKFQIVMNKLYNVRKEQGGFEDIMICAPPGKKELWMVKKTVELEW